MLKGCKMTYISGLFSLISWQTKLCAFVLILAFAFVWHKTEVKIAVNTAIAEVNEKNLKDVIRLSKKAQDASKDLSNRINSIEKEKNAKIESTNRKYTALLGSLSNRPNRPSEGDHPGNPSDSKGEEGTTAVRLYKPDAEFLARFSRDSSELQIELNSCYKQYDSVKEVIDKFRKDNNPSEKP